MSYLETGCRWLLLAVFAWSAGSKLRSRAAFGGFARSLTPLVRRSGPAAAALVVAELLVAVAVLVAPAWGFALAIGLLGVLTAGVLTVLRRRIPVRCRCFGTDETRIGRRHVVRNVGLLAVAVAGLCAAALATPASAGDAGTLLAAAVAVVLATAVVQLDELVELFA